MRNPCFECKNRYGKDYSIECDDTCDYAKLIKGIKSSISEIQLIDDKDLTYDGFVQVREILERHTGLNLKEGQREWKTNV